MRMEVINGLHAFIWRDGRANNCNTYLIDGSKRILVDPGHHRLLGNVREGLVGLGLSLDQIDVVLVTHGHPDHLEGVQAFTESNAVIAMSEEEFRFISKASGGYLNIPEPDFFLQEGDLKIGDNHFKILSTPGHSPGSISFYWSNKKVLFTGDVIFRQSIGRTDLPGGRGPALKESIQRLSELDIDYLMPGHGELLAGSHEVRDNFRIVEQMWLSHLR
jgi:glyoxylase-like metal-dependent hydrolase (beta-lactamase superfamily II)